MNALCRLASPTRQRVRGVFLGRSLTTEWRKSQLDMLEKKFSPSQIVESEDELQPMWKQLENRVKHRRPLTLQERGPKVGRMNIKRTDEELWLEEGLYDSKGDKDHSGDKDGCPR
jgi:hypothetical protein